MEQPSRKSFLNLSESQRKILFTTIAVGLSMFFTREATLVIFLLAPIQFINRRYGIKTMVLAAGISFVGIIISVVQQFLTFEPIGGMEVDFRTILETGLIILGLFLGLIALNIRSYGSFKPFAWMRITFASVVLLILAIPSFISLSQPELYDQVLAVMSGNLGTATEEINLGLIPFENEAQIRESFSQIVYWIPRLLNIGWVMIVMINWYLGEMLGQFGRPQFLRFQIAMFKVPRYLLIILAISLGVSIFDSLVTPSVFGIVAWNILILCILLLMFNGISRSIYYLDIKLRSRLVSLFAPLLVFMVFLFVPFPYGIIIVVGGLTLLGIADMFMKSRTTKKEM